MKQVFLPYFSGLFLTLTGIKAEEATVGEDGWLFVPPEINMDEKYKYDRENFKVLGWRENLVDGKPSGWWVNPWSNIEPGFIAITLNEVGAESFTYLRDGKPGQRYVYFIDRINIGSLTGAPMLLGQFVFEFEGCPAEALHTSPGGMNRIYYPRDKRVAGYYPLTDEEREETRARLSTLEKKYSDGVAQRANTSLNKIDQLIHTL